MTTIGNPVPRSWNGLDLAPGKRALLTTPSSRSVNCTAITFYACVRSISFLRTTRHLSFVSVRKSTGEYPTPSLRPSHPSSDTLEDMTKDYMEADGTDYRATWCKVRTSHIPPLSRSSCHARSGSFIRRLLVCADRYDNLRIPQAQSRTRETVP